MFRAATLLFPLGLFLYALSPVSASETVRMIRSLSGPTGKAVGPKFILDEIRNRFVYPQDNSLTVYFECQAPKGDYTLTAYWKDPQGRTVGISPDLKVQTGNNELNSYWVFIIDPGKTSGIWTVELRANGEPVGSHSFELVMPVVQQPPVAEPAKLPTLDELYRSAIKSLVWVHKLDKTGARMDTTSGFVVAPECVLTAFQSIDMATALEIEFADGTGSRTDEILAVSRLRDWALVKAGTRGVSPLQIGKSDSVVIGEQAIVFSVGSGALRTISAVDIAGRGVVRGFGERIQINPQLPSMAVGGPLLDNSGKVVGIIGGGVAPGMFADPGTQSAELALLSLKTSLISATPIEEITLQPKNPGTTLQSLLESGVLTPPLSKMPVFYFGAVTDKVEADLSYVSRNQFSRKDSSIIIYTMWRAREKADKGRAREKADKGSVSLNIYDANNRLRSKGQPRILELQPGQLIWFQYSFNMNNIEAGLYRMDLLWNGDPIWRASISLVD